jgi:hypothetical protein
MVDNIAEAEYESTFHIMIVGVKGAVNTFIPIKDARVRPVDIKSKESDLNFLEEMLPSVADSKQWTVFDLRPLKSAIFKNVLKVETPNLRRTILGYDAIVFVPLATPSNQN